MCSSDLKTYRFVVPIYKKSGNGTSYWGITGVCNLNTTTAAVNPYFAVAGLPLGRWYLFVGYIYPEGSLANTSESAGIWDTTTGVKIAGGTNYCFQASTNPTHRAYQYYADINSEQLFGRPFVNVVDGTEPSLLEYFSSTALLNSNQKWTDVASRPTSLATLNSTDGSKLAGIAAGATANQADSVVNAALDDRLKKSGTDIMSGQVQLTSSYAMWFGTSGYANGPTGVYIGSSGIVGKKGGAVTFSLDNAGNATFGGNVVGAQFTTGAYTGYAWPAVNNYGTYLGPSGLLIGNANNNKYLQVTQDGNIYAPGLTIVNGATTFSGALSAASGTFSGTLTASAVNAVNTINLAGQAVTIPVSAFTAAAISYTYSTQVQTATITSTGAPIIVLVSVALDINAGVATMVIKRNGTDIYVTRSLGNLSVCLQDTPGAGPKTYTAFVGWGNYSTDATYLASYRTIVLLETKR